MTTQPSPLEMLNLTCPNCGAALRVAGDARQAQCSHCGTTQLIQSRPAAGDDALRAARLIRLEGEIEQSRRAMVRGAQWLLLGAFCFFIYFALVHFIFFAVLGGLFLLAGAFLTYVAWKRHRALKVERDE